MAKIQKVTDPARVVTDPEMLRELARQNIDKDYVEFFQDYGAVHVGLSPYAKFYRDLKSGRRFMVVSGLPKVTDDGAKVVAKWLLSGGSYLSKTNLLSAAVELGKVEVKVGENKATWNPQLFLNGVEQSCSEATLLGVDPDNENYHNNVLEWDYGICKRRLRLIEGAILGRWLFAQNPNGDVRIKYNQSGELKLGLGQYKISDDEEFMPESVFDEAEYPFEIGDSLTVYSGSSDRYIYDRDTWATVLSAATGDGVSLENSFNIRANYMGVDDYKLCRGFVYIDASALPDTCTITNAVFSLYGAYGAEADAGFSDLCLYEGTQADPATTADYDSFNAILLSESNSSGYTWAYPLATDAYNDAILSILTTISKTGPTKFALRLLGDVNAGSAPTGGNANDPYQSQKGSGFQPKLVVTYTGVTSKTSSDTGSGSETLLSRAYVLPEVGTGSEALSSRLLGAVEQGAGAETLLARLLASTETASGLDFGGLFFVSSDVGSGLDAILALEAILTGADSGSGIDTAFLIKALLSTDSGLGTEAVAALLAGIVAGELMVGSDRLVVKIESAPTGGGMRLPPGGKTSIPSRRVNL